MHSRALKIILVVLLLTGIGWWVYMKTHSVKQGQSLVREVSPSYGSLQKIISATGTVLPKNRLAVKPPVNGRIDQMLVKEGEKVKAGQVLAWMSSTERAALLDAARGQGAETLDYWSQVYKAIPLVSPIDGEVIVATIQPGQSITTNDPVAVISDQLIIRAQVDETDIGHILVGQKATVIIDAYPQERIDASVEHLYYESATVNNVTIYQVDLTPQKIMPFFRSGMNATIDFIIQQKDHVLVIPQEAVYASDDEQYVFVRDPDQGEPRRIPVQLGLSDDKNVEILSGVTSQDVIIVTTKKYTLPSGNTGSNPFMPRMSGLRRQAR